MRRSMAVLLGALLLVTGCGTDDDDANVVIEEDLSPTEDVGPTIETMPHGPISEGTTYVTYSGVEPEVSITPQSEGWHLGAYSCDQELTSIRLATEEGRMYIVLTAGPEPDEAIAQLAAGPLENTSASDTTIAGWSGQVISGQLVADIDTTTLGNYVGEDHANRLLPYFQVRGGNFPPLDEPAINEHPETARILFQGLVPHAPAEVHVVDTPHGVLSVAITTSGDSLDGFRSDALATADSLTIGGTTSTPTC